MLCDPLASTIANLFSLAIWMQTMQKLRSSEAWTICITKPPNDSKNFIISPFRWEQRFCVDFPSSYWVCPLCQSRLTQSVSPAPSALSPTSTRTVNSPAQLYSITGFYITFGVPKLTFPVWNVIGPAS